MSFRVFSNPGVIVSALVVAASVSLSGCGIFIGDVTRPNAEEERQRSARRIPPPVQSPVQHAADEGPTGTHERPFPPQASVAKPQIPQHHVNRGDTMYSVAWRYGLDYRQLAAWNDIRSPYLIYPGQNLNLQPATGSSNEATSSHAPRSPVETNVPPVRTADKTQPTEPAPSQPGWEIEHESPVAVSSTAQISTAPVASAVAGLPPLPKSPIPRGTATAQPKPTNPYVPAAIPEPAREAAARAQKVSMVSPAPRQREVVLKTRKKDGLSWNWPTDGKLLKKFDPKKGSTAVDIGSPRGSSVRAASKGRVVYSGGGLKGYGQLIIVKHGASYLTAYAFNNQILVEQGDEVRAGQIIAHSGEGPSRKPMLRFEVRKNGKPVNPLNLLPPA